MRIPLARAIRGIALPTVLCSLVGGGAVAVMAVTGLLALDGAAAAPLPAAAVPPPAAVEVRLAAEPSVTVAPTAQDWAVTLPGSGR
jgi:hypothetical protein